MDFVEGLPRSYGFDTVLVVVDRFTKYAHFVGLKHPFTAITVATLFVKEVVRLHGFPTSIMSDKDCIFLSAFLRKLFHLQGTNKGLETFLRYFISGHLQQWTKWISWAKFCYNTSFHSTRTYHHFKLCMGDPSSFGSI